MPTTGLNFSTQAQQMLFLARKESERLNHNFVGSEHLLLGLFRLGQGTGFKILQRLGIDPDVLRREIERSGNPAGACGDVLKSTGSGILSTS